ncbi:hypothetical protein [Nocardiopsis synnemataformans]|uniref:hypothetical protein n=1 Tax=Nocardiopsis synnemataformans TaxID=61305 RepID=UPI003EBA9178
MRYPQEKRPDPLIQAIEDRKLTPKQASAVADLVQTVLLQAEDGAPVRPGTLMDLTIADATRYQVILGALRANRADLYPAVSA